MNDGLILTIHSEGSFDITYPDSEDSEGESELGFDIVFKAKVDNIAPR